MACINLVTQGWTGIHHREALQGVLQFPGLKRFCGSVAFARANGVKAIESQLKLVSSKSRFFVGIRNGVTSKQALEALLTIGVELYAVDTAKNSILYHPKAFLSVGDSSARLLIGSANLTHSGLCNNIEFGAQIDFDLNENEDKRKVQEFETALINSVEKHPNHILKMDQDAVGRLFDSGRLEDELIRVVFPSARVRTGKGDDLAPIALNFIPPPVVLRKAITTAVKAKTKAKPILIVSEAVPLDEYHLVWQSNGLKERDLNVPSGENTSETGSMFWKKGAFEDVDQRHYFRDTVFKELDWAKDASPAKSHFERSNATFRVIIKGLDLGDFWLKLSHNTKTDTKAYIQGNSMTQVSWGTLKAHIAKRDLLGRILKLYKKVQNGAPSYLIEID
jgi:HKD family nuclease